MNKRRHFSSQDKRQICLYLDPKKERNLYLHKNLFIRDIFWQRIETIVKMCQTGRHRGCAIDIGGGNGVLAYFLAHKFSKYYIIDPDAQEAEKIASELGLTKIIIYHNKIEDISFDEKASVILAADVLEHFEKLAIPVNFIQNHLHKNGKLIVSLPTENFLYRLGRVLIRKDKPLDHYHCARTVLHFLYDKGFRILHHEYVPRYTVPVPLFSIATLSF